MRAVLLLIPIISFISTAPAYADQLACNSAQTARRAVQRLPPGSIMIDYCSKCTDKIEVIKVHHATSVKDCSWEVEVVGERLYVSHQRFDDGRGVPRATYRRFRSDYRRQIDLAYVYVERGRNDFRWLGGELGLSARVNVKRLRLPSDVYKQLGPHVHKPRPRLRAQLKRFLPCLEIDSRQGASNLACVEPVKRTVSVGAKVHAWSSWKGRPRGVVARFVHQGRKHVRPLRFSKSRGVVGMRLMEAGDWVLELVRDGQVLKRTRITVR